MGQGRALEAGPRAFIGPEGHREPGKTSFGLRGKLEAREETVREQRGRETGTSGGIGEEETEKCEGRVPGRGGPGRGQTLAPAQLLAAADLEPGASVSSPLTGLPNPPSLPVSVRIKGGDNCWDVVSI